MNNKPTIQSELKLNNADIRDIKIGADNEKRHEENLKD